MPTRVSSSSDISFYPTLAPAAGGGSLCAWYEYGAPDRPARSDVWAACRLSGEAWSDPVNVSGGDDYNNGPSVVRGSDGFLLAWHSWRPPGRSPFTAEGDVCNVWTASSTDGARWCPPRPAVPSLSGTEYPSLAVHPEEGFWLVFQEREGGLRLARSHDGVTWDMGEELPMPLREGRSPGLAVDSSGILRLACAAAGGGFLAAARSAAGQWSVRSILEGVVPEGATRPRISAALGGGLFLTCHSSHWGTHRRSMVVEVQTGTLSLTISARRAATGAWTLNTLRLWSLTGEGRRDFTFGERLDGADPSLVEVRSSRATFDEGRGFGFDGPVEELVRELGDPDTRTLVYGFEPRTFRVRMPPGRYRVEIVHSSWIAPQPHLEVSVAEGELVEEQPRTVLKDRCWLVHLDEELEARSVTELGGGAPGDRNRPSEAVVIRPGVVQVAWTEFGDQSVDIVAEELECPKS